MLFPRCLALLLALTLIGAAPWAAPSRPQAGLAAADDAPTLQAIAPGSLLDFEAPSDPAARLAARADLEAALAKLGVRPEDWRRAGESVPPGMPAERTAQRRAQQAIALAAVETALEVLKPEALAQGLEQLWQAAESDRGLALLQLRLMGLLGRQEFAARLALEFNQAPTSRAGAAARRGLFELYGVWFANQEELAPFLSPVPAPAQVPQREALRQLLSDRVSLYQQIWSYKPERAGECLRAASPRLRSEAARSLADWARSGLSQEDPLRVSSLALVLQALVQEGEEAAFAALLEAASALWSGLPADAPQLIAARGLSARAAAVAPGNLLHVVARAWLSVPGLPALPPEPVGDGATQTPEDAHPRTSDRASSGGLAAHGLVGVDSQWSVLEFLFERLLSQEAPDEDVSVALIEVLRQWARSQGPLPEPFAGRASSPLFRLLRDPAAAAGVRSAAAAAMRDLVQAKDLLALLALLGETTEPGLRFELLQVLERVGGNQGLQPSDTDALVRAALLLLMDGDPEVRRRALGLLQLPRVAEGLDRAQLAGLLSILEGEQDEGLSATLLALLAACDWGGQPLALLRPKVLQLVASEAQRNEVASLDHLAACLTRQAGSDVRLRMEAARELMRLTPQAARSRCAARAFALAAPTDEAELEALAAALGDPREEHLVELLEWATLLAELKLERRLAIEAGLAQRLLEVAYGRLLPRAAQRGALDAQHQRLFEARLSPAIEGLSVTAVQAAIQAAQAEAPAGLDLELERSAARFLCARGETSAALEAFARLLERGDRSGFGGGALSVEDWRQLLELSLSIEGSAREAEQAIDLGRRAALALLACPEWSRSAPSQALADLENATAAIEDASDQPSAGVLRARLRMALSASDAQPSSSPDSESSPTVGSGNPRGPTASPWAQLFTLPGARPRLERLELRLAALEARNASSPSKSPETGPGADKPPG